MTKAAAQHLHNTILKANPLQTSKQFCADYHNIIDWDAAPNMLTDNFINGFNPHFETFEEVQLKRSFGI